MSSYLLLPDKELLAQTDSDHAIICTLIQVFFFKATSLLPVFPAGPHRTWKQHLPYHISCPPAFWKNQEWLFRRHTAAKSVSSVNSTFIFLKQKNLKPAHTRESVAHSSNALLLLWTLLQQNNHCWDYTTVGLLFF